MSIASVAAQQAAATAAASSSSSSSTANPLGSLSSNFNSFLHLLMTQLQNQDPTSPLDTNQFTSQLVQFSSVEQQITTNGSLTQLIQLTQGGEVVQSTQMLGHKIDATSTQVPLQGGAGTLKFNATTPGPVSIVVTNAQGQQLLGTTVNATAGGNTWNWNGQSQSGAQLPDGAYDVSVTAQNADGSTMAVPFTVEGTATGVTQGANAVQLQLGDLTLPFSSVTSVVN